MSHKASGAIYRDRKHTYGTQAPCNVRCKH